MGGATHHRRLHGLHRPVSGGLLEHLRPHHQAAGSGVHPYSIEADTNSSADTCAANGDTNGYGNAGAHANPYANPHANALAHRHAATDAHSRPHP